AQAQRRPPSAPAAPGHLRRIRRKIRTRYEETSGFQSDQGHVVRRPVYCHFQLRRHDAVELAHASPLWLAAGFLLASGGHLDPEQDSLRRVPRAWRPPVALAAPHDGTLGTDDAGRTREISPRPAKPLVMMCIGGPTTGSCP